MSWVWVWWVATGVFVLNGLRLRAHASHLHRLPPAGASEPLEDPLEDHSAGGPGTWRWAALPGLELPPALRSRVEGYALAEELQVVDLVPRDLPMEQAIQLVAAGDPGKYRALRLAPAMTAAQATVVERGTWCRARLDSQPDPGRPWGAPDLFRLAGLLKRYAATTTDLVVVGGVRAVPEVVAERRASLRARFGPLAGLALWLPALRFALLAAGVVLYPLWGGIALAVWCFQPVLALAGTPLAPRDLWWGWLLRWLLAPFALVRAVFSRGRPGGPAAVVGAGPVDAESLRPLYEELLAGGTGRFFEERRQDCPMCGSKELRVQVRSHDLLQRKPGTFVLDRCRSCSHVFQNPRLSPEGLDFYYRDFYDGLSEERAELVFAVVQAPHKQRAAVLDGESEPGSWLDVGTGHGHFCLMAQEHWPKTRFDGLDLGAGVEEAARRGWITTAFRGQFVDLSGELAGSYDVVSMHHYLEHTRDPGLELDAAAATVAEGGYLSIEVPDPDYAWGGILGAYWLPWFQPQHQHMLPLENLEAALRARRMEIVKTARCRIALPSTLTASLGLLVARLAPPPGLPWRRRSKVLAPLRFAAAATVGALVLIPLAPAAFVLDMLVLNWLGPRWRCNAYRVLARRPAGGPPPAPAVTDS